MTRCSFRLEWIQRTATTLLKPSGNSVKNMVPLSISSGGFSNVSFQMPSRRLINDVFMILAVDAGADSGIIDPVTNNPQKALSVDRRSKPYQLTKICCWAKIRFCRTFLRAYRKGELEG